MSVQACMVPAGAPPLRWLASPPERPCAGRQHERLGAHVVDGNNDHVKSGDDDSLLCAREPVRF